jgi:hypothetical protein
MEIQVKRELILIAILLLSILYMVWIWGSIPPEIPMHYSFESGWDNRKPKLFICIPLLSSYFIFLLVDLYIRKSNPEMKKHTLLIFTIRILFLLGGIALTYFIINNSRL